MQIVIFYTPVSSAAEASSLGKLVVEEKLAACANSFPSQSTYLWENTIQEEGEMILLLKTIPSKEKELSDFLEKHHSYDLPAILHWAVEVNEKYGQWVEASIR